MRIHYGEVIADQTFEAATFKVSSYQNCTFKNCIFKDTDGMNVQVAELFNSGNKLIGCWYNPILILTKLLTSLNDDVNIIDSINKALIRAEKNAKQTKMKQLVLLEV